MRPPVVSVVGKSGAGKTTLIERLVPRLTALGIKVSVIKHDAHRFEIDHEGKDSYRHFHAGSEGVVIASAEKLALVKRLERPMPVDEMVDRYLGDADIVITEGYKNGDKPKIEVFRPEAHSRPLCGPEDNLAAMVTNEDVACACPRFKLDDVDGVAQFLLCHFISGRTRMPPGLEGSENGKGKAFPGPGEDQRMKGCIKSQ